MTRVGGPQTSATLSLTAGAGPNAVRIAPGLRSGHSPLRRRCDRAEAAIVAGLLAGFLGGAPVAAVAAGQWPAPPEHAQQAARQQVMSFILSSRKAARA